MPAGNIQDKKNFVAGWPCDKCELEVDAHQDL